MILDALIVGGGMVGLAAAKDLSQKGLQVAVIEKHIPELAWPEDSISQRVSAINRASELYLQSIGVWSDILIDCVSPYFNMHVWDELGQGKIDLKAQEAGETELGFIVENRVIVRALWKALEADYVNIYSESAIESIAGEPGDWQVLLSNGKELRAKLIIGADGANSWVRKQFDFDVSSKPYGHKAIVATIQTEQFHQHAAWQCFLRTGPLAFLPLKDGNTCSIVWSAESDYADTLMKLNECEFNQCLAGSFDQKLGACKLVGKRVAFPLMARHVTFYYQEGVVLLGDAAHTIHPLAGQGVNLGFQDSKALVEVLFQAHKSGRSLSHGSTLAKYQRQRQWQNQTMIYSMKGFKELFGSASDPIVKVRSFGLDLFNKMPLAKRLIIKNAMGL